MQNTQNQASRFMGNQGNAQAQTTVGQLVLWAALYGCIQLIAQTTRSEWMEAVLYN